MNFRHWNDLRNARSEIHELVHQFGQYERASSEENALQSYAKSFFSQNGEDGMIQEAVRRLKIDNPIFVEFGASNGVENCTRFLLENGGRGLWVEGDNLLTKQATDSFGCNEVDIQNVFVDKLNVVPTIKESSLVSKGFDILVMDLDGNDYWLLAEILRYYKPLLIIAEYNPVWGPKKKWVMPYNPLHQWNQDQNYGASLNSYDHLLRRFGYKLIACDPNGVNAFWVTNEESYKFADEFTAEHHFAPPSFETMHRVPGDLVMNHQLSNEEIEAIKICSFHEIKANSQNKFQGFLIEIENNTSVCVNSFGQYPIRIGLIDSASPNSEPTRATLGRHILPRDRGFARTVLRRHVDIVGARVVQEGVAWGPTFVS